jgi:prepilin-type N-terminal cleavage/methylation domain-containing protein/prepilin-type processing-associated H-X9-DG protein
MMAQRVKHGFTLIELLVVISIMAILAAMISSVLAPAREKARQAMCVSNLHHINSAWHMYLQDNDEAFPVTLPWFPSVETSELTWPETIQPYLKNKLVLHCASDTLSGSIRMLGHTEDARATHVHSRQIPALSYGANSEIMSAARNNEPGGQLASIPNPVATLLVSDASEMWAHGPVYTDFNKVRWSHIAYANGPPETGLMANGNVTPFHGGRSEMNHERHSGGSNVAFMDGHIQFIPSTQFIGRYYRLDNRYQVQWPLIWPYADSPK